MDVIDKYTTEKIKLEVEDEYNSFIVDEKAEDEEKEAQEAKKQELLKAWEEEQEKTVLTTEGYAMGEFLGGLSRKIEQFRRSLITK